MANPNWKKGVSGNPTGRPRTTGAWKPGQSGNPGGRTKQEVTIKELAQKKCPAALKRLEQISNQNEDLRSAVAATMGILAYGIGKPSQQIDLTNSDGTLSSAWAAARAEMEAEDQEEAGVTH
jgi:hypothetical protein